MLLQWPIAKSGIRVPHQRIDQKRKREHKQRIELKRRDHIAMKQLVQAARATASGTSKSGERAKRAGRKKA
jgi:hypothetical protein